MSTEVQSCRDDVRVLGRDGPNAITQARVVQPAEAMAPRWCSKVDNRLDGGSTVKDLAATKEEDSP
jgi:hypothetical protein